MTDWQQQRIDCRRLKAFLPPTPSPTFPSSFQAEGYVACSVLVPIDGQNNNNKKKGVESPFNLILFVSLVIDTSTRKTPRLAWHSLIHLSSKASHSLNYFTYIPCQGKLAHGQKRSIAHPPKVPHWETDRHTDGERERERAVGRMTFNRIAKLHAVNKKKKQESKLENNQNLGCPSCTYMYYTAYGCNSSYTTPHRSIACG